jgi:RNA polymerase sigma-70 factor (ECF subfamily)
MMSGFVDIVLSVNPDCHIPADLERQLGECAARAIAAWPTVRLDSDSFVRAIAKRLDAESVARSLDAMWTDDLYLAVACAAGASGAIEAFEAHHGPVIARAIASACSSNAERADLGQIVRQRLLVSPAHGGVPRIATYSARGALRAWVRVVASREVSRMMPRAHREVAAGDDELAELIGADSDPEVAYLKRLYREEFKRAFHAAADALDARDRLLLRQHALDGLSIDQLSTLHGVHRATAARWIDAARQALLAGTQRQLIQRLRLSRSELASVMRLIQSQLDVTLPQVLRSP